MRSSCFPEHDVHSVRCWTDLLVAGKDKTSGRKHTNSHIVVVVIVSHSKLPPGFRVIWHPARGHRISIFPRCPNLRAIGGEGDAFGEGRRFRHLAQVQVKAIRPFQVLQELLYTVDHDSWTPFKASSWRCESVCTSPASRGGIDVRTG